MTTTTFLLFAGGALAGSAFSLIGSSLNYPVLMNWVGGGLFGLSSGIIANNLFPQNNGFAGLETMSMALAGGVNALLAYHMVPKIFGYFLNRSYHAHYF